MGKSKIKLNKDFAYKVKTASVMAALVGVVLVVHAVITGLTVEPEMRRVDLTRIYDPDKHIGFIYGDYKSFVDLTDHNEDLIDIIIRAKYYKPNPNHTKETEPPVIESESPTEESQASATPEPSESPKPSESTEPVIIPDERVITDGTTAVGKTGYTNSAVYFRSGPGTSYSILHTATANTQVYLMSITKDGWYEITYDNQIMYVYKSYISDTYTIGSTSESTSTVSPTPSTGPESYDSEDYTINDNGGSSYVIAGTTTN